ncbi:MAG TPA: phosphatase PAP2 family protein [Rhizomicrobium sp.]|nr:phosphatase PAP2 family protein [Rhizomicrobium sp.]
MFKRLEFDFGPEWLALLALAVLDLFWARAIGFHLGIGWSDGKLIGLGLLVMVLLRLFKTRGGMMAEYFSLTAMATVTFGVMSYLCLASSGPLVDTSLQAADRALNFNWMAGYHFIVAHHLVSTLLSLAYNSLVYQGLYFCVLFALMDKKKDLREMFWLVLVTGLFTSLGVLLFPALGPFKLFGTAPPGSFLPEMEHLKSGQALNFALGKMTGVVSFPSFHTSMALAYAWGFRKMGAIAWAMAVLNFLMLCAIPWYGGHYLIDMIAGAGVMLVALAIVRIANRQSFAPMPQSQPVAG